MHLVTSFSTVSHSQKKKYINNFQDLPLPIGDFTGFNSELRFRKGYIYIYDITTTRSLLCYGSITSKANLYVFGISRLTKNHQYKIRLRRRLKL